MKTILIIEDIEEHFKVTKAILESNNFSVVPSLEIIQNNISDFDKFKLSIRTFYDENVIKDSKDEAESNIKGIINSNGIEGIILDYELEEKKWNCNGINFYNNFIFTNQNLSSKTIVFLTKMKGSKLNDVIKKIEDINNKNDSKIAFFFSKGDFKSSAFKKELTTYLLNIFSNPPRKPKI